MRKPRRNHSAKFKAQVALEAIRGERTIAEIAAHHEVHPTQVTSWKNEVLEKLVGIFGGENSSRDEKERIRDAARQNRRDHRGERFFGKCAREIPRPERQALIERGGKLAVKRQHSCWVLRARECTTGAGLFRHGI